MLISDLLIPKQIKLDLVNDKRLPAISEVAALIEGNPNVVHLPGFYADLLAREQLESTLLVTNVSFAHARTDHLKGMVLAIGRSKKGIVFENTGKTVRLIFVVGTPKRMATEYLSVVGALARVVKGASTRNKLLEAPAPEDVIDIVTAAEKGHKIL